MEKVKAVVGGFTPVMGGLVPPRPLSTPENAPDPAGSAPASTSRLTAVPVGPIAVLDELGEQIDGVHGAILASVDGFGLARSTSMADEASHPAMLAAAVGLARQLVSMGGGTQLRQLVVDHDAGLMLVWPIGTQRVLAVLASSRVDQRQLRTIVQRHAATLAGATP